MTLTITCWSDEDPAVRQTRNHDNLMAERDYRDANPPADGWDDLSDLLDTPTFPVYHDETRVMEIPLTQGKVALVDYIDYAEVSQFKWNAQRTESGLWYAKRRIPGNKAMKMHRFILGAMPGELVDHADGNGLNNTRKNLRIATVLQSQHNRRGQVNSSTPFKGVFWVKKKQFYKSQIKADGKQYYLGQFEDPIEAALAYDRMARDLHGEFACVNFPTEKDVRSARIEFSPRNEDGELLEEFAEPHRKVA